MPTVPGNNDTELFAPTSNETLTSVALDFVSSNIPTVPGNNDTELFAPTSNQTLTSVALDFVSSNMPTVLIASSMLHQAAKTVRRCIRRFIGSSDKARQQAVAAIQQQEDAHFRTYLSRMFVPLSSCT